MNPTQRRMAIYDLLLKQSTVEVSDLSERFHVSTMTIRRDLILFEKQGLVTTTYGGAYLNQGTNVQASFVLKSTQMVEEKTMIGCEAAKLIEDGDTIIIDCGSTTLQIAKYIQDKKVTIITNSWPLINYLGNAPKVKLVLAPGEYSDVSAGAISSLTSEFFKTVNADKVFISTQGCDFDRGITVPELIDADVKRTMMQAGKVKILLIDHQKIRQTYLAKHADIAEFDCIITDRNIPQADYDRLSSLCARVIKA